MLIWKHTILLALTFQWEEVTVRFTIQINVYLISRLPTLFLVLRLCFHRLTCNPVVYFEATGIYSRPVMTFCERNQLDYVEVNPLH